jgi:hypothetical protein
MQRLIISSILVFPEEFWPTNIFIPGQKFRDWWSLKCTKFLKHIWRSICKTNMKSFKNGEEMIVNPEVNRSRDTNISITLIEVGTYVISLH